MYQIAGKRSHKRSGSNKKGKSRSMFSLFGKSGNKSSMWGGKKGSKKKGSKKKHSPKKVKVGGAPWWM